MNVQASLKVLPKRCSRQETYDLVDDVLRIIKKSGLKHEIGVSETTVEGTLDNVFNLITVIHKYYFEKDIEFSFFINTEFNLEKFYIDDKKENIENL